MDQDNDDEEEEEGEYEDYGFIVDDEGRPIAEKKKKKRKPIFNDAYVPLFHFFQVFLI